MFRNKAPGIKMSVKRKSDIGEKCCKILYLSKSVLKFQWKFCIDLRKADLLSNFTITVISALLALSIKTHTHEERCPWQCKKRCWRSRYLGSALCQKAEDRSQEEIYRGISLETDLHVSGAQHPGQDSKKQQKVDNWAKLIKVLSFSTRWFFFWHLLFPWKQVSGHFF